MAKKEITLIVDCEFKGRYSTMQALISQYQGIKPSKGKLERDYAKLKEKGSLHYAYKGMAFDFHWSETIKNPFKQSKNQKENIQKKK